MQDVVIQGRQMHDREWFQVIELMSFLLRLFLLLILLRLLGFWTNN